MDIEKLLFSPLSYGAEMFAASVSAPADPLWRHQWTGS
jgi:hypothetical protein